MVKDYVADYLFPLGIAWLACYRLIRPRLRLLLVNDSREANSNLFYAVLVMAIPLVATRQYVKAGTGKLTALDAIHRIEDEDVVSRYYTLQSYYLDARAASFVNTQKTRNKGRIRTFTGIMSYPY